MRFWASVSFSLLCAMAASAQAPPTAQSRPAIHRKLNELTLAGLRPGRDTAGKALRLFGKPDSRSEDERSLVWSFERGAGIYSLNLDLDKENIVQFVRVSLGEGPGSANLAKHALFTPRAWGSGHGLSVGADASEVTHLYGEPDSRSPSTKGGQPLELLYYAFDWAGAEVPQVMEVACSVEKNGTHARVVEITLAAPSL